MKYHSRAALGPHPAISWGGTVPGGQFDWGGRLPKGNGGAQWFPQGGWKSPMARKGRWELDCEADRPSRDESRA